MFKVNDHQPDWFIEDSQGMNRGGENFEIYREHDTGRLGLVAGDMAM